MLSTSAYSHSLHTHQSTLSSIALPWCSQFPYFCCTHCMSLLLYVTLSHVTLYFIIHSESVSNVFSTSAYSRPLCIHQSTLSSIALPRCSQSPYLCCTHYTSLLLYVTCSHVTLYFMIYSESVSNMFSTSAYSRPLRIHQSTLSSTAILLYSQLPYLCCTHSTTLLLYVTLSHVTLYSTIHSESVSNMLSTSIYTHPFLIYHSTLSSIALPWCSQSPYLILLILPLSYCMWHSNMSHYTLWYIVSQYLTCSVPLHTHILFVFTSQPYLPLLSHYAPNYPTFVVLILPLSYYMWHSHMSHYTLQYIVSQYLTCSVPQHTHILFVLTRQPCLP
jgi:hypothetical protein